MDIPNVWETANQSVKWAYNKRYKLYGDVSNKSPHFDSGKSKVTWVIGIRLADMFPPGMIEANTLVPDGYAYRVVGPHHGNQVRRQDLHKITILCSPQKATGPQGQQVQRHNYDTFINVMASIFEKYGTDILM